MQVVMELAHRITVLHYGEILAEGTPGGNPAQPASAGGIPQDMSPADGNSCAPRPRRGHPHLLRQEPYPAWRLAGGGQGRGGGAARPQRRRQEHDPEGDHGARPPSGAQVLFEGDAVTGLPAAPAGAARDRLCAGGSAHLPAAHGHGESAHRARPARRRQGSQEGTAGQGLSLFPGPGRTAQSGRRHAFRRRAADARDRAGDDAGAQDRPAGRTDRRADAADGLADPARSSMCCTAKAWRSCWWSRTCR